MALQDSARSASVVASVPYIQHALISEVRRKKDLQLLKAWKPERLLVILFPIVKILHLHLETMPPSPALAVNSHTSESKVLLSLVTIQPHNITATPW